MTLYVGSDHAGLDLKLKLMSALPDLDWKDLGTYSTESVDYPDYAQAVCEKIVKAELENTKSNIVDSLKGSSLGILICGSGQGMAIKANRYKEIRAALCWNEDVTRLSREHNNSNILCIGARFIAPDLAVKMTQVFLKTSFEGGRHQRRVEKLGCS